MDVLELPRPVINFLRTMSKEMHRYSLCWDIYGGSESVTLTLTWKINQNDNQKQEQQQQQSDDHYSNPNVLSTAKAKTKSETNLIKQSTKQQPVGKQFQHSKLDTLAKQQQLQFQNTNKDMCHMRNLSAESNKVNYEENFLKINNHQSRRLNPNTITTTTSNSNNCQECNKCSDTSKIGKKAVKSAIKTNYYCPPSRGKSLESHESSDTNTIKSNVYSNQSQQYQRANNLNIPISIVSRDSTNDPPHDKDFNTRQSSNPNPWIKRSFLDDEFDSNNNSNKISISNNNNNSHKSDNNMLNLVESTCTTTTTSQEHFYHRNTNMFSIGTNSNSNTNNSGIPSVKSNNNGAYSSSCSSSNPINNNNTNINHSKVTFDPKLEYI